MAKMNGAENLCLRAIRLKAIHSPFAYFFLSTYIYAYYIYPYIILLCIMGRILCMDFSRQSTAGISVQFFFRFFVLASFSSDSQRKIIGSNEKGFFEKQCFAR